MQTNHAKKFRSLGARLYMAREARRKQSALIKNTSLVMAFILMMGLLAFPVGGVQAASTVLKEGMTGGEVKTVQNMLVALDYLNQSDGAFGPITEKAVIKFQRANDLEDDGIVGRATRKALESAYDEVAIEETLREGDEGVQVRTLQRILRAQGYLKDSADGEFGPKTEKAVIDLQESRGLETDGVVGPATLKAMNSSGKKGGASGSAASSFGDKVVAEAMKYLGIDYKWAGTSPSEGFDCSGLVHYVYKQLGYTIPRTSSTLRSYGTKVDGIGNARPGDILCWSGHVGIYIGENRYIHAPKRGDVVRIATLSKTPIAIRRVVD